MDGVAYPQVTCAPVNKKQTLERIDAAIVKGTATITARAEGRAVMDLIVAGETSTDDRWVDPTHANAFRTAGLTVLQSLLGVDHQLYKDFEENTHNRNTTRYYKKPLLSLPHLGRWLISVGWTTLGP